MEHHLPLLPRALCLHAILLACSLSHLKHNASNYNGEPYSFQSDVSSVEKVHGSIGSLRRCLPTQTGSFKNAFLRLLLILNHLNNQILRNAIYIVLFLSHVLYHQKNDNF